MEKNLKKVFIPTYDNGLDGRASEILFSKYSYETWQEAEKEILEKGMSIMGIFQFEDESSHIYHYYNLENIDGNEDGYVDRSFAYITKSYLVNKFEPELLNREVDDLFL